MGPARKHGQTGFMKKRSVKISGHETSISLEDQFWDALKEIAETRGLSLNSLIAEIDEEREGNLSSAMRIYTLEWFKQKMGH